MACSTVVWLLDDNFLPIDIVGRARFEVRPDGTLLVRDSSIGVVGVFLCGEWRSAAVLEEREDQP